MRIEKIFFVFLLSFLVTIEHIAAQEIPAPKKVNQQDKNLKPVKPLVKKDSVTYTAVPATATATGRIATADELYIGQGTFLIRTASDYRYLTIKDISPVASSMAFVWSFVESPQQQVWQFVIKSDGYWKIKSESGLFLTQKRLLTPTMDPESNEDSQLWQLTETTDGYYTIKSKTNKYLKLIERTNKDGGTVSFANESDGTPIFKWHLIKRSNDRRRVTSFIPETHGFRFVNTFNGEDIIRWGGLCGGMVYSALDYFRNRISIPQQTYTPANATTLQSYIYQRQQHSMWNVNEKWSELEVAYNFRAGEIYRWGIQGTGGGRLEELKNAIDAGRSVPIGLFGGGVPSINGGSGGNHVVLAIGYSLGRYTGDFGSRAGEFKILAYDPNMRNKIVTLVPDLIGQCYFEVENGKAWRTYFVNTRYDNEHTPPRDIPNFPEREPDGSIRHIYAEFATGKDDLRGGNDNVSVVVRYTDGTEQVFRNVNNGARWVDNSWQTVHLELNRPVRRADISYFRITTSFGSDIFSDDWNLGWFRVTTGLGGINITQSFPPEGSEYIFRFSGDQRRLMHVVRVQ
jgi:Ricin-type beta-trefoil lectin domain-like